MKGKTLNAKEIKKTSCSTPCSLHDTDHAVNPRLCGNGTATLSDTTMTESGSITVTFSETASNRNYYNVQIADNTGNNGEWGNTLVNTNVTSGTTYTISGYSAGTYYIYVGYYENGNWKSDALSTTTFTVTEDTTADYTAELSATTMNEDGEITVTFHTEADSTNYYVIEIADSNWDTKYVDTTVTSGDTYTISGLSAGTYAICIGYYKNGNWESDALNTTFTVTNDTTANYKLTITLEDGKYQETYNDGTTTAGTNVYSTSDTVNVTVVVEDDNGSVTSLLSGYDVYVWFEDEDSNDNSLTTATTAPINETIDLTDTNYSFTTGVNYNVYARVNKDGDEVDGTMVSTSFTINTTYSAELTLDADNYDSIADLYVYHIGDTVNITTSFVLTENGVAGTTTTSVPDGTMLTLWYTDDTGTWYNPTFDLNSRVHTSEAYGSNPTSITLSSNFSAGTTYYIYAGLYNEGGEMLAYAAVPFTINAYASFYTRTLTLDGAVAVNYYVDMTGVSDPENYSVVFSGTGITTQTATYNSGSYRDDFGGSVKYYRFTLELDSTQMGLTFNAVLTYNGTTAVQTDSGYSVEKYCKSAITGGWAEADVCAALLNYGGYSQTYFDANTGSMANKNLTTYDDNWSDPVSTWAEDVSSYTATVIDLPSEITGTAVSLVLESETVIRLYFNANDASNLTFTVDDTELKIMNASSGSYSYYVEFSVQASRLKETFTVTVSNGTDTGTVKYSAYAYINTVVNDSTGTYTDDHKNVCKALYYYAKAADEYSNWYTGLT